MKVWGIWGGSGAGVGKGWGTSQVDHVFWADDVPITSAAIPTRLIAGHRQVTDMYLLGLSVDVEKKGRLVTFDRKMVCLLRGMKRGRWK